MSKTVWVVQGWVSYEGNDILSIWEIEDEAREACDKAKFAQEYLYDEYTVEDYEIGLDYGYRSN